VNKHAEEIIASIIEEFSRCDKGLVEFEAKSLFRLLNYCPPRPLDEPVFEKPGSADDC
jgi:hypothetical protein